MSQAPKWSSSARELGGQHDQHLLRAVASGTIFSHELISLQSGSNGNCIYVQAGGVKLLFDAGIGASEVQERLAQHGRDANAVDAVPISHDHIDHCRSMGILNRTFGLPIYATAKTFEAAQH